MSHKPIGADTPLQFRNDPNAMHYFELLKKRVEGHGSAVVDLTQSISNPPTQAEVTAIQNKINELLASLREGFSIGA